MCAFNSAAEDIHVGLIYLSDRVTLTYLVLTCRFLKQCGLVGSSGSVINFKHVTWPSAYDFNVVFVPW